MKYIKTNDIKKGTSIRTNQLGYFVNGVMEDNNKGMTRLITTKGSEIGLFDEMGSVYAWNIVEAYVDNEWCPVELTDKQIEHRKQYGEVF